MKNKSRFLTHVPPMCIYETLYAFQNAYGTYMGEKGTHPWSQGFPLTSQIPGGPEMPVKIKIKGDIGIIKSLKKGTIKEVSAIISAE